MNHGMSAPFKIIALLLGFFVIGPLVVMLLTCLLNFI
ncbi:hypothetical protein PALA111701_12175 [Paenibacillus lactis]